jgi:hypothetical protein
MKGTPTDAMLADPEKSLMLLSCATRGGAQAANSISRPSPNARMKLIQSRTPHELMRVT